MVPSQAAPADASQELIADRYRVEKLLGRGGMAAVYQVEDVVKHRVVALKRLLHDPALDPHVAKLFEREYHTLSQLVHPRIIAVYDYHTDAHGPFYTMELLTGGDLRQRAPVSWREACRLLCDVCSALSLLHSRRFVHRDLTPLNIRCTADERAKLFDFGSMAQFGRSKHVVGTPPFVAPEALHGQQLDGQTDLFSLGATAYYALTGRHAYPARTLAELPDLWRAPPQPPSGLVSGIPGPLDDLVMSLLQLQPNARPASAAEVMERLSAIGGVEVREALVVGAAYLSAPTLVGRDEHLASFARQLRRAAEGRGTSILVQGEPGAGCSRLLDACALEAKLAGPLVLRADPGDSGGERWGAISALLEQLLDQLPELGAALLDRHAELLVPVLPRVYERLRRVAADRPSVVGPNTRGEVQATLRELLLEVSRQRPLVLVVEDLDRVDEPSAALLALLAHQAREHALLLLTSVESEVKSRSSRPVRLVSSVSDAMRLRNLDAEQTQQLVISLFGDVPNVRWLADRVFQVTRGNPGRVMRVAQHLVERGVCHYAAGAWTLPATLSPDVLADALRDTIDPDLPESALDLARALALSELERVSLEDCVHLCAHGDPKQLQGDLHQLAAAGIAALDEETVRLSGPGWQALLLSDLPHEALRMLHLRLAAFFESRPGDAFRLVQHLCQGGEVPRALALLVTQVEQNREQHMSDPLVLFDYLQLLPKRWPETFHVLIEASRRLGRPVRERMILQFALLAYSALTARYEPDCACDLARQLRHDTGLDLVAEYQGKVPDGELLGRALGDAQKRFDGAPEAERGLPVFEALTMLGQLLTTVIGMAARSFDVALLESMPSLQPLTALSPALAVVQQNIESTIDIVTGRPMRARKGYIAIIDRLDQPDGAGLGATHRVNMYLAVQWALGAIETSGGRPTAPARADVLAGSPLFAVSALRLRAIHALMRGDRTSAEQYRMQTELLQIQNCPPQILEGSQAMQWAFGYAATGDLLRVKQCLGELEAMAREHVQWKPVLHVGRAAYQGLRGDHAQSELECERALALMRVGRHAAWPFCASNLLWALVRQDRFEEAVARGRSMLIEMEAEQMDGTLHGVQVPLAFAESAIGQHDHALAHIQAAIEYLAADGGSGVALGHAYEVRAYIALNMRDAAALADYAARCEEQYNIGRQPGLLARHHKLERAGRRAGLLSGPRSVDMDALPVVVEDVQSTVSTVLSTAQGSQERADRALALLGRFTRCEAGFLYVLQRQGPALVAQLGSAPPMADMDAFVARFLLDALERRDVTQTEVATSPEPEASWPVTEGTGFTPMLLSHVRDDGMSVTGVAVMSVPANGHIRVPTRLLQALSKALYDAGDAITQLSHELEELSDSS